MEPVTAEVEPAGRASGAFGVPRKPPARAPEPVQRAARAVVGAFRAVVHRWRTSLQFRVLVTTALLCTLVIGLLGSYLYRSVADGLVADRVGTARFSDESTEDRNRIDGAGDLEVPTTTLDELLADVPAIVGSIDIVMGEVDR